jgi:hypothetical protein
MSLPTIVVECGWNQPREFLEKARDLWLIGGSGAVELVIIIKLTESRSTRKVEGDLGVFEVGTTGEPSLLQKEVKLYMLIINIFTK